MRRVSRHPVIEPVCRCRSRVIHDRFNSLARTIASAVLPRADMDSGSAFGRDGPQADIRQETKPRSIRRISESNPICSRMRPPTEAAYSSAASAF
jgi:hypothetical protein